MPENPVGSTPPAAETLGEFLLSLVQAFLRTGYYLPEHPESKKAKSGLYHRFHRLAGDTGEMTFLVRGEGPGAVIHIEGLGDKSLKLSDVMLKGMAQTYNPRFVHFLERKELVSLSLGGRMSEEEFSRFIDIVAEPSLDDMREHASKKRFVDCLKERGISHLSFVFNEDFITEHRHIPWRAVMALSRLRKDISLVPIFRNLKREEIGRVRREILDDIMRPLNVPELVYAFLMNLDLARTADLGEEESEDEVVDMVREEMLLALATIFIADASGRSKKFLDLLPPEKFPRVLGKLCRRLNQAKGAQARNLVEEMFNAGLLSMEQLPPEVRERVMNVQIAMKFIDQKVEYLKHFDRTTDPADYPKRARTMARIIPCLLERGKYTEAVAVTERLQAHAREDSPRGATARALMSDLAGEGVLDLAAGAFLEAPKEGRVFIGRFFNLMGQLSVPHLLGIIDRSDDPWKSKQAAELLTRLGPEAAGALLREMARGGVPARCKVTVLRVLAEVPEGPLRTSAMGVLREASADGDPELRREALAAIGRLAPRGEFDLFREKLTDPDPRVARAAVKGLGQAGDARALGLLTPLTEKGDHAGGDDGETAAAAVEALGHLHESCPETRAEVDSLLLKLAGKSYPSGALRKLLGPVLRQSPALLPALADALGRVGGEEAFKVLRRMTEDGDRSLARRAAEQLKKWGQA